MITTPTRISITLGMEIKIMPLIIRYIATSQARISILKKRVRSNIKADNKSNIPSKANIKVRQNVFYLKLS